jgi:hypothetical protein
MLPEAGGEGALVTRQMWLNRDCRLMSEAGSDCCTTGVDFSEEGAPIDLGDLEQPPRSAPPTTTINKIAAAPFPKNIFALLVFLIMLWILWVSRT